jgi:peroxiredoxin
MPYKQFLKHMVTNNGLSVENISHDKFVLLVFLRHFECVFCRESMLELSKKIDLLERNDVELIFVHMAENNIAEQYFRKFNLEGVKHVSDPGCRFYLGFGLVKGRFDQLFGLKTALRGFEVMGTKGIFPSLATVGDGLQMPGIFVIQNGEVKESFIHTYAADKPDYNKMIEYCAMQLPVTSSN